MNSQGPCFLIQLKKSLEEQEDKSVTRIRILEATMMTVVKYDSGAWALRKTEEDFLEIFPRYCPQTVLGSRLTDRIYNGRLYEMFGSISLSSTVIKERLRWLWHILWMKDARLPMIVLFGQPSGTKQKAARVG